MIIMFLIFVLAHCLSDFIIQTDSIIKKKQDNSNRVFNEGIFIHIIHHFIIGVMLLVLFGNIKINLVFALIIICFVHYFIDLLKIKYDEKMIEYTKNDESWRKNIFYFLLEKRTILFLLDQTVHILTIYMVLKFFNYVFSINEIASLVIDFYQDAITISLTTKITSVAILLILLTWGSSYLIAEFFKDIKKELNMNPEITASIEDHQQGEYLSIIESQINALNRNITVERTWEFSASENEKRSIKIQFQNFNEADNNSVGKYIGIFERILIAIFVFLGAYQGLVLLGGFKTLTRFKQFEDKSFAEYYLIGTLFSMLIGVTIGEIIKKIVMN
ncbi:MULTISPECIES: DUF3307 domain-containing protein [Bacillus]|uniref:DUF3307 domain-containing protein n=1 Tax=Bacillus TaxID=1386 RepID=UPI000C75F876|nr:MULTISPECIES: DUF3307 domain-containing protein [Bacillus]PLR85687.1 hypothetical protein CVD23_08315 [Bacillus sp. V33-4]RSK52828.1 DUF3307 domain-containing protein [Bacillus canaveralius]